MNKGFRTWFFKKGYKKYIIPTIIAGIIDIGVLTNYKSLWTDNGMPFYYGMVIIGHIILLGFHGGLIYHLVSGYRLQKKRDNRKK